MAVIGGAAVEVRPVFNGFASAVNKELSRTMAPAGQQAGQQFAGAAEKSMGSRLGGAFKTTAKVGAAAIGGLGIAMAGLAAKGGIDRALNLEDARGRLIGLGHDTKTVETIMDNAYNSTLGTAYRADEAAKVAASAVAAGIKPGKELESTLALMGDAAYIAGTDMGEMGAIFNKVAASDMIQGDVIAQLGDRGIPILQLLADEMGVTATEVRKLASDGEIDFATFRDAMDKGMGGAAQQAGETTRGAIANMMVGFSRIGQTVVEKMVPQFRTGFNEMTVILYGLNDRLAPVMENFAEWLGPKMDSALDGFGEKFLTTVDTVGPKVATFFGSMKEAAQGLYDLIVKGDFTGSLREAFGWEEDSAAVDTILNMRDAVAGFFEELRSGDGEGLGAAFSDIWESVKVLGPALFDARQELPSMTDALKVGASVLGFFADNVDTVVKFMPLLLAGFAAWKAAQLVNNVLGRNSAAGMIIQVVAIRSLASSNRALAASYAQSTVAQAQSNTVKRVGFLTTVRQTAANVAHRAAVIASTVATKAMAAGQRVLNAVMRMNPIGLVITAIMLLVGAFIAAYKNSETFRTIVQGAWQGIKTAASAVWEWLKGVFKGMKDALTAVGAWFGTKFDEMGAAWDTLKALLGVGWSWVKDNVFKPFKDGISAVGSWFSDRGDDIAGYWDDLKTSLKAGWDWINDKVFGSFKRGLDKLGDWVSDTKDNLGRLWDGVRNIFRKPINWVIDNVWNDGLRRAYNAVASVIGVDELDKVGRVPAYARGGRADRGWALVGEEGPELVNFSQPGRVYTADETQAMLNQGGPKPRGAFTASNPPHGGVWETIKSAAGAALKWVRGGLAKAAGLVLTPLKDLLGNALGGNGKFGDLLAGASTSAIDGLLGWIKGKDSMTEDPKGRSMRGAQPHVNAAAWALADKVGGIRRMDAFNNSMAGGHPKGLAVDFIDTIGKLNSLADVITDTNGFGKFSYMAWQGRTWAPGRGWAPQTRGYGNDPFHRWHVHGEWYDQGGKLMPGVTQVMNGTGSPEAVLTSQQWADMHRLATERRSAFPEYVTLVDESGGILTRARVIADQRVRTEVRHERAW